MGVTNKYLENSSKENKADWIDLLPPVLSAIPAVSSKLRNRPPAHLSNNEDGFYPSNTNSSSNSNSDEEEWREHLRERDENSSSKSNSNSEEENKNN